MTGIGSGIASALRAEGFRVWVTGEGGARMLVAVDDRSAIATRSRAIRPGATWVLAVWPQTGLPPVVMVTAIARDIARIDLDPCTDMALDLTPGRVLALVASVRGDRDRDELAAPMIEGSSDIAANRQVVHR